MPQHQSQFELLGPADGVPVTFSHALGSDRQAWRAQVAALSGCYRVLSYDIRGHGADTFDGAAEAPLDLDRLAQDVLDMWDALGIQRSHFVGLSLGGCIGTALALRAPQRLRSLVVANARLEMDEATSALWQQRSSAALAAGNLAAIAEPTVARWLTLGYARAHPQTVEQLRSTFLATRAAGYAACAQALSAAHLEQGLAQLEVPTLFISGQADLAVPTALTLGYSQQNPAFKYQALEGSHLLAVENPSAFNAAVLNFIAGHNTD